MNARGGGAWWNDETQSWEQGAPPPGRDAPPSPRPPDPPVFGPPYAPPPPPPGPPPYAPVPYHEAETARAYELPRDPAHPPAYAPVDPGRRRQRAVVAAVAVAVLAGGAAGGWLLWGRDDGSGSGGVAGASASAPVEPPTDSATDAPTPTDTPTDTPTTTPTDDTSGPPGATHTATPDTGTAPVPEGYRQVDDPLGWSVAVPAAWTRTEERGSALYRSPDERYLLQMFRLTEPGITPYEAMRLTSANLGNYRGYEQISLRRMAEVTTTDAAELVYAYNRTVQTDRIQGIARAFVAGNGVPYTVLVYGPDEDWPLQRGILNRVLGTFAPE
ncbi:hypothetical protein AB0M57_11520 [Streptomyces sp. NPDC051597]|uniref:hypothetical protein n=1 Tax=Streptomyces sp. NPDC051597 TaxID=3155049 RepID=UPI0034274BFF